MTFSHCWDWYWGDVTTGPSIRFDGDNGVHQPGLGLDVWSGPHTSFPPTRTRVFPENGRPGVQNGASETVDLKVALPPIAPLCRVSSTALYQHCWGELCLRVRRPHLDGHKYKYPGLTSTGARCLGAPPCNCRRTLGRGEVLKLLCFELMEYT